MVSLIFLHHGRVCPFFSVFFFFFLSFLTSIGEIIITYAQEIPSARLGVKKKNQKKKKKTTEVNKPHQKRYVGLIKMRLTLLFTANAGNHGSFSTVFCHSFGFGFWVCQS